MSERDWRLHKGRKSKGPAEGSLDSMESVSCTPRGGFSSGGLTGVLEWVRSPFKRNAGAMIGVEELVVHEMVAALGAASRPEEVERSLLVAARRLTTSQVECASEVASPAPSGRPERSFAGFDTAWDRTRREVKVRLADQIHGALVLGTSEADHPGWSKATVRRVETLCTLSAFALERLRLEETVSGLSRPQVREDDFERLEDLGLEPSAALSGRPALASLQDATFLNAVLPFAVSQARRYGEPLSLLCVDVDRLTGIHNLFGRDWAERSVVAVGQHIAARIRSSDIIARIDDDRIIVVLPRAGIHDAWKVAQNLCRSVAQNERLVPDLPAITVSIGVAEYPACAATVYALLDSADHALTEARGRGRNRAIAAEVLVDPAISHRFGARAEESVAAT